MTGTNQKRCFTSTLGLTILVVLISTALTARAGSLYWVGSGTGNWSDSANWSGVGVLPSDRAEMIPGDLLEHRAVFDLTAPLTLNFVRIDGGYGGGRMILEVPAGTSLTSTGALVVGESSFGQLLQQGTVGARQVIVTNSNWPESYGSYRLSGAAVLNIGSDGFQVGSFGGGEVVQDNGEVTVGGDLRIGRDANIDGTTGYYTLNAGRLSTSGTTVGAAGDAVFTHNEGLHQISGNLLIGSASDLRNSVEAEYRMGGGDLQADRIVLGRERASRVATVLFQQTGGTTDAATEIVVAEDSGNSISGTLQLAGGVIRTPAVRRGTGGMPALELLGGELQTSTIELDVDNQGTVLRPFLLTGLIEVTGVHGGGDVRQSAGTLKLGLAGFNPGVDQGRLVADGSIDLAGEVAIDVLDGFTPLVGDTFTIAQSLGGVATLDPSTLLTFLDAGYVGRLEVNGSGIDLVIVPEPATLSLLSLGGLAMLRRRKRRACK